ncbi:hypothetical protein L598_003100000320 [Mesorhizobium sp. J18]|uniref:HET-C-related protein n=1 Tax=Mesorhizobium sp. J18 TaxID=935263 RepID=UPI0011992E87|nr:HET-C-related protein [Mesorhizobium sp. J18]TWG94971.1 hypothetical protein L598_003100000320 [Mesorhizobium sp. J18]
MRWSLFLRSLACAVLLAGIAAPLQAAEDPEQLWPCIQRRVPELSLPQIWNGPELPPSSTKWAENPDISALVTEVAARRIPLDEAKQKIRDHAAQLSGEEREEHLLMLVQGLFDHMNAERSDVMAGIERYTRQQAAMADALRKETADVDQLRQKPDADPKLVAQRTEQLTFETRIFQERAQSLTYVCEVPTLIEQRLYQLTSTIANLLAPDSGG